MTANNNHKINQLKWFYSAISGVCVAYFFALFSGSSSINGSYLLQLSTLFFAICFPIFTSFAFVHIALIEDETPTDKCIKALKEPWVIKLTTISFVLLFLAFVCLVGHYSIYAMAALLIATCACGYLLKRFFRLINNQK